MGESNAPGPPASADVGQIPNEVILSAARGVLIALEQGWIEPLPLELEVLADLVDDAGDPALAQQLLDAAAALEA